MIILYNCIIIIRIPNTWMIKAVICIDVRCVICLLPTETEISTLDQLALYYPTSHYY